MVPLLEGLLQELPAEPWHGGGEHQAADHSKEELSHYSNATTDIEYLFPFGWGELWGIADRTDFDLKAHMEHSGENFTYQDPITNEKYE